MGTGDLRDGSIQRSPEGGAEPWWEYGVKPPDILSIADKRIFQALIKAAITSKIKHAIKLKTSPARLAQLLQPSLAFCFSLQPMAACRPATVVQVLQDLF